MVHFALYQHFRLWWWCIGGENMYLLHFWSQIASWTFLNASTYLSIVYDHIWPQHSHFLMTISSKATYHANNLKLFFWIWQCSLNINCSMELLNIYKMFLEHISGSIYVHTCTRFLYMSACTKISKECFWDLVASMPQGPKVVLKQNFAPSRTWGCRSASTRMLYRECQFSAVPEINKKYFTINMA